MPKIEPATMSKIEPWGVVEMSHRCGAGCGLCMREMGRVLEASLEYKLELECGPGMLVTARPLSVFVPVPPPREKVPLRQVKPGVFVAQCYYCDGSVDVQYLCQVPLCAYCREGRG
jgi:bacterioferritin-associated ferredoxin